MVLVGLRDSPLTQTSPEMDLGSPSIWVDSTGQSKTELRRTGHTCFVKMKMQYLKCCNHTTKTESNYFSHSFVPDGAGGGVKDASCRVGSVEFLLGVFAIRTC